MDYRGGSVTEGEREGFRDRRERGVKETDLEIEPVPPLELEGRKLIERLKTYIKAWQK